MRFVDHLAIGLVSAELMQLRGLRQAVFVAASVFIDLDHYPGAIRKYGVQNPLRGAIFALTGDLPGLKYDDQNKPIAVDRPLHRIQVALVLSLLAMFVSAARPVVLGVGLHFVLDLADVLVDGQTR